MLNTRFLLLIAGLGLLMRCQGYKPDIDSIEYQLKIISTTSERTIINYLEYLEDDTDIDFTLRRSTKDTTHRIEYILKNDILDENDQLLKFRNFTDDENTLTLKFDFNSTLPDIPNNFTLPETKLPSFQYEQKWEQDINCLRTKFAYSFKLENEPSVPERLSDLSSEITNLDQVYGILSLNLPLEVTKKKQVKRDRYQIRLKDYETHLSLEWVTEGEVVSEVELSYRIITGDLTREELSEVIDISQQVLNKLQLQDWNAQYLACNSSFHTKPTWSLSFSIVLITLINIFIFFPT